MTIRLLIADVDNTIFTRRLKNPAKSFSKFNEHLLSPALIDHAKRGNYQGFYLCTHRCHRTIEIVAEDVKKFDANKSEALARVLNLKTPIVTLFGLPDYSTTDPNDSFLYRIKENFQNETGLECLGVSTPDDKNYTCGAGYKNLIQPCEKFLVQNKSTVTTHLKHSSSKEGERIESTTEFVFPKTLSTEHKPVPDFDPTTKNEQLLQIIHDACEKFNKKPTIEQQIKGIKLSHEEIILTFIDDNRVVANKVADIKPSDIPENVTLIVLTCYADTNSPITPLDIVIKGTKPYAPLTKEVMPDVVPIKQEPFYVPATEDGTIVFDLSGTVPDLDDLFSPPKP